MNLLDRNDLESLATVQPGPCVSIFLPTHREGLEYRQDPIRLKNLLREAEESLGAAGLRRAQIDELLAPARDLLPDTTFWEHQGNGLAVLLSPERSHVYRLPLSLEEIAVVANRFYLKPLLPLLSADGLFYVLAIGQQSVRLFEATRHTIREIDLLDIPTSLRDALGYDWEQRSLQFHTGAEGQGSARRRAMFHGHGEPADDQKQEIASFFRIVDRGLLQLLENRQAPLVVSSVDHQIAIYREVSAYPNVVEEGVAGSPKGLQPEELHERAWEIVEPLFLAGRRDAAARYDERAGTGLAGSDLREVVPAAFDGRVATLFVARDARRWGRYDPGSRSVEEHAEQQPGDRDLLEVAAIESLVRDADVYAVDADEVPGGGGVAAIYRY